MNKLLLSNSFRIFVVFSFLCFTSCKSTRIYKSTVTSGESYHSSYDDTTLTPDNSSILMPYNRFIHPAGTVIRFGNTSLENHSLDCALLPGEKVLVVEDRYGLAFIDVNKNKLIDHLDYRENNGFMSTYSGLKVFEDQNGIKVLWGAANPRTKVSSIMEASWNGKKAEMINSIPFVAVAPAPMSLPNDIALNNEGGEPYLYVVLNGNSQLVKLRLSDNKIIWQTATGMAPFGIALTSEKAYVTNWAGSVPVATGAGDNRETAGIPYGNVYIEPKTGATSSGTVSIIDLKTGKVETEIKVGLHPNAIIASKDQKFVYVANGNSDNVSVINTSTNNVVDSISVSLSATNELIGDSPNGLAINDAGNTLYVSNGMDNAVAVISLGENSSVTGKGVSSIKGFIPTEAYPAGLALSESKLYVSNLEGEGARVKTQAYNSHHQEATISIISLPAENVLNSYTKRVEDANLIFRTKISALLPRKEISPKPVPERIGEPSVFKHVVYIIKENRTYDQVLGDMKEGNGDSSLCIYGSDVTPNEHKLAKEYLLLDNYYASGKSSAEGHSWTDAAIVTDYVEKNVRAWFRSYPHVLADALVYNKKGFLWNNALDHGKTVRIYGEACSPVFSKDLNWTKNYQSYLDGAKIDFKNTSTISRVRPIMSVDYPCYDGHVFTDQLRADAFIKELDEIEKEPGDQLPQLMILALPLDHTSGMREGFPTPRAMVADNDLALGRIIEALTKSRFWDSTVVFITEDDSQDGWDHVSAYRTTGFVISPYSRLQKTVHTNYNQTCVVRTIEQILGIPPMNVMDATALPMFDCFTGKPDNQTYSFEKNIIPLNEMNKSAASLSGKAKKFTVLSSLPEFDHIDGGNDDLLNRILWFASKGNTPYPKHLTVSKKERKDSDDD
ncbi:MAG TPA: bifunctional YncE family protein/alkaline phosphatase family protein [Hanamia sp.]|nr:bifunctional YncE family protein/alkaline phosphatase family protein [Hanamia sp.]